LRETGVEGYPRSFGVAPSLVGNAARDLRRFGHVLAVAVHMLLGAANLVFWDSFVVFGMVPMGVAATVVHFVLVVAHAAAFMLSRDREPTLELGSSTTPS
jgi:hypothetical protein